MQAPETRIARERGRLARTGSAHYLRFNHRQSHPGHRASPDAAAPRASLEDGTFQHRRTRFVRRERHNQVSRGHPLWGLVTKSMKYHTDGVCRDLRLRLRCWFPDLPGYRWTVV